MGSGPSEIFAKRWSMGQKMLRTTAVCQRFIRQNGLRTHRKATASQMHEHSTVLRKRAALIVMLQNSFPQ